MLRVVSIFTSISGEVGGFPQGAITQFVRFGGCNLRCAYCDTKNTQPKESGQLMTVGEIVQILLGNSIRNVVLTGGEPLLQKEDELVILCGVLFEKGFTISIETNGTIPIPFPLRRYCSFVMDYKMDMPNRMLDARFLDLGPGDWVKFPIADEVSLIAAIAIQRHLYKRGCLAKFAYSPIFDQAGSNDAGFDQRACSEACIRIIEALESNRMGATLNLQIHKIILAE